MPFFSSNKFSPKRTPPRKVSSNRTKKIGEKDDENLKLDGGRIKLKLGAQESTFQDGDWIPGL